MEQMNYKEFKTYVDEMNKSIADKLKGNEEELAFYIKLVEKFNEICEENAELKSQLKGTTHCYDEVEHRQLKEQLEYLRSDEYYNQLRFENKMLQDIVDNGEVSKEDKEFIDCTHRNTELLNQQQEFIKYLENYIELLSPPCSYNNQSEVILIKTILSRYKEIIGDENENNT